MDEPTKQLAGMSFLLLEHEEQARHTYFDFGYIVFPLAKAYEGFLKQVFYDLGLINRQQFAGEHFRIGKALNPNLPVRYRSGWVYQEMVETCKGEELPLHLWEAWKHARNQVFHYFPGKLADAVTLPRARDLVMELSTAMERAMVGCELGR